MDLEKGFPGNWRLSNLPVSVKVLFTGYMMAIGLGLLMAGGQIMLTHGMADGKFGLSVEDIVYSYYGNRSGSTLEAKLLGSMKDKGTPESRIAIIDWARRGAPEAEWEPKFKEIFHSQCVMCHSVVPGIPDFREYKQVYEVAKVDEGASIDKLTRVSHIHLFGISFIFFFVGLIFTFADGIKPLYKYLAIATPFAFLVIDVLSWWLTKMHPGFAWLTIIGGVGYSIASTYMLFTSLYQMWIVPWRAKA